MASGARPRGSRHRRKASRAAHGPPRRGEPLSGGFVEVGEVAGWIASEAIAQGGDLTGPMEAEHYASHLASMWESAGPVLGREKAAAIGYGVAERLHESDRPAALPVLTGLAVVAEEPIAGLATCWSADRAEPGPGSPVWLESVGRAEIVGAGRVRDPTSDDGTIVLFDLAWPSGEGGGLGVFIDHRLSGIAKHILVGPSIAECVEEIEGREPDGCAFERLSHGDAAAVVRDAVEATEASADAPVGETYVSQRGFLRARISRPGQRSDDGG